MESSNDRMRASTDGAASKSAERIVEQVGRRCPERDQRCGPRVATPAGGHRVFRRLAGDRIGDGQFADGRKRLVARRGEFIPDIVGDRVGGERAAQIRLQQARRHAHLVGEEIAPDKIRLLDDRRHLALEVGCLRPGPVLVPAIQIVRRRAGIGVAAGGIGGYLLEWQRAHVSANTTLPRSTISGASVR